MARHKDWTVLDQVVNNATKQTWHIKVGLSPGLTKSHNDHRFRLCLKSWYTKSSDGLKTVNEIQVETG